MREGKAIIQIRILICLIRRSCCCSLGDMEWQVGDPTRRTTFITIKIYEFLRRQPTVQHQSIRHCVVFMIYGSELRSKHFEIDFFLQRLRHLSSMNLRCLTIQFCISVGTYNSTLWKSGLNVCVVNFCHSYLSKKKLCYEFQISQKMNVIPEKVSKSKILLESNLKRRMNFMFSFKRVYYCY